MCRAVSPGQRVAATLQEFAGRVVGAQDRGIVGLRGVQGAAQAAEEVGTDRVEQVIPTQLEAIHRRWAWTASGGVRGSRLCERLDGEVERFRQLPRANPWLELVFLPARASMREGAMTTAPRAGGSIWELHLALVSWQQ